MIVRVLALALVAGALGIAPARAAAQSAESPEERRTLERRVEEMERQFRAARDEALALCRGGWTTCINNRCKQIARDETQRWQACQNECDATYERCQQAAIAIWPDE